jgi:hypothetical protein
VSTLYRIATDWMIVSYLVGNGEAAADEIKTRKAISGAETKR